MRKWILLLVVLICGCTEKRGGEATYLLPWPDAQGNYGLQEVTISTLSSPFELQGSVAQIYTESPLTTHGYQGSVGHPHLTKAGRVYVPQDAISSISLAVYAQYERLYQFEQRLGVSDQISWPRQVGVELHLIGKENDIHNNAHYFTTLDATGLVPYTMNSVPVPLNHGIVAHEHFHAHFQQMVLNRMSHGIEKTVSALENMFYPSFPLGRDMVSFQPFTTADTSQLNNVVMRGWNEGLADFFAYVYTGDPDFFISSRSDVAPYRALDLPAGMLMPAKDLTMRSKFPEDLLVETAYEQGTLLARLLYHLSIEGEESPELLLRRILLRLSAIPAQADAMFTTKTMDFESVIPLLLKDYPVNMEACAELGAVLSKEVYQGSFASCASF